MLVLTRKLNETIHIGDGIVIRLIQTGSKSVKIGIEAPQHVRILRGEVAAADLAKPIVLESPHALMVAHSA